MKVGGAGHTAGEDKPFGSNEIGFLVNYIGRHRNAVGTGHGA